jgi:hypothetical protein
MLSYGIDAQDGAAGVGNQKMSVTHSCDSTVPRCLLLLLASILTFGCAHEPSYSEELARLEAMQTDKQALADHYQQTLHEADQAQQELRDIHQQRIDLQTKGGRPSELEAAEAYKKRMDAEFAPQLGKVRSEYDAAMQKLDREIKQQEARVQRAKDRARS